MIIKLIKGDITKVDTDIIVNAANKSLLGGGGVDGAIHKAGGKIILEECIEIRNRQGGCKTGDAVYTSGGNLNCKYIIHTVGPIYNGSEKDKLLLENCYRNSMKLADELNCHSIAFPNISTGVYCYPKVKAAKIAIETIKNISNESSNKIEEVIFVCFDDENFEIYENLLKP